MLSPEEIRQLDGPALTKLAFDLCLAPEGAYLWPGEVPYANRDFWEPHFDLDMASAVFRSLRARGWSISVRSQQAEEPGSSVLFGVAEASHRETPIKVITWWSTAGSDDPAMDATEAMALLRASVLVMAWMQKEG